MFEKKLAYLLMDGAAVRRLDQDFDTVIRQLPDMAGSQWGPPFPGVDVLTADSHDGPVVLVAPLSPHAAGRPAAVQAHKSEHDFSRPADRDRNTS